MTSIKFFTAATIETVFGQVMYSGMIKLYIIPNNESTKLLIEVNATE